VTRQRYRVLNKIDAGGMAEIYLARAVAVGGIEKNVAIKRVLPALTKNKRFVNMFLDEARLSMVLTHANIVQVFDVGRADGTYFIVMEYVDGQNLRRIIQRMSERGYRIAVPLASYLIAEVCKGLSHAHDQRDQQGNPLGIVHRDISPPNILISRAGEVKITDFGLAKAITQFEITDPGIVKGKFSYLSPEAANGKLVDHRADIFAAGILLWELLAGRRLFLGKSDMETVSARTSHPPSSRS
jgi:eukaryotic-like serine/threonine-protein kinase